MAHEIAHELSAVMWREGTHHCELWVGDGGGELRVYVSNVLAHREPVRPTTLGLHQAAILLARARRGESLGRVKPRKSDPR